MSLGRDCFALGMTSVKAGGVIPVGEAGKMGIFMGLWDSVVNSWSNE